MHAGIYNGAILPPLVYVPGGSGIPANRSLTMSNAAIWYDTCTKAIWEPVVGFLSAQDGVRHPLAARSRPSLPSRCAGVRAGRADVAL